MGRSFYENDALVINKPGLNVAITDDLKEKESNHGNISYIDGMAIRSTPLLEQYANSFRAYLNDKLSIYSAELGTQTSCIKNELTSLRHEVDSTIKEPVLPNIIYILTATLSGSIISARRTLPLRFITPVIFGTAATAYFTPRTFNTITSKYESFERKSFPEFNQQKHNLLHQYYSLKSQSETSIQAAKLDLENLVHEARYKIADLFSGKRK